MADKGIIFSAPMVRALLDGRKTQTRRLMKPLPIASAVSAKCVGTDIASSKPEFNFYDNMGAPIYAIPRAHGLDACYLAPYAPGDRLYVREACYATEMADDEGRDGVTFLADDEFIAIDNTSEAADRWASRLTLLVAEVRVQRIQQISEADAIAEGAASLAMDDDGKFYEGVAGATCRCGFAGLWNSLHTTPGEHWDDNPWIVAVTFEVQPGNIDQLEVAA